MDIEMNWLAVILATLSTLVVGSLWYTPKTFGNTWMKLAKIDKKAAEKRGMLPILITIAVTFITAIVLAHITYVMHLFYDHSFLYDAINTALWLWVGLVAARIITHDAFEGRPLKLTAINLARELVTLLVMGTIIGLMGV